jgi:mycothiol synthase
MVSVAVLVDWLDSDRGVLMATTITFRSLTRQDIQAIYDICCQEHRELYGTDPLDIAGYEKSWLLYGFNPETDTCAAWVDGQIVGYVDIRVFRSIPVRPSMYGYVRPAYRSQGIASWLLAWARQRAEGFVAFCPPEARVTLTGYTSLEDGRQLLLDHGYTQTRQSYMMELEFDGKPQPMPTLPDGFRFQSMAEGATLREIAYLYQETFRDHRGSLDEPLEAAMKRLEGIFAAHADFDPAMVVRVLDGDTPAGVVIATPSDNGDQQTAYIHTLGVISAYRKRGLGMALLQLGFHLASERGKKGLVLGVDAASLTGAVRLYERAGMKIRHIFHVLELEIRPGVELTNQG